MIVVKTALPLKRTSNVPRNHHGAIRVILIQLGTSRRGTDRFSHRLSQRKSLRRL